MFKFIVGAVLSLAAAVAFAKPVAYADFDDGRVYLTDQTDKCPGGLPSWKFEFFKPGAVDNVEGCFILVGGDVVFFLEDGKTIMTMIPAEVFKPIADTQVKNAI